MKLLKLELVDSTSKKRILCRSANVEGSDAKKLQGLLNGDEIKKDNQNIRINKVCLELHNGTDLEIGHMYEISFDCIQEEGSFLYAYQAKISAAQLTKKGSCSDKGKTVDWVEIFLNTYVVITYNKVE